jgi:DNA repair protein RadC
VVRSRDPQGLKEFHTLERSIRSRPAARSVAGCHLSKLETKVSGKSRLAAVIHRLTLRVFLGSPLDNPESIYRACADMKLFNQEVLRVILLDTRYRHSSTVEITKGSINESLAYPRDVFRPVIGQSAYAFVLVHNVI